MMQVTKKIEVKAVSLNGIGQGIVYYKNKLLEVPYLLQDEEALIEYQEGLKYNNTRIIKLLKQNPSRIKPSCGIYEKCGGCHLLHMHYQAQLAFKANYVLECYKKEKIPFQINEIISTEKRIRYRNKMQVAFQQKNGKIIYGFYEEGSHRIIPLDDCLVQTSIQLEIVKYIHQLMIKMRITPYDEDRRTGTIRFVLLKEGFQTGQVMVVLVTNSEQFPGRKEFIKALVDKFSNIKTIVQNVNSRKTSIILGDQEQVLYGTGFIEEELCGLIFRISSKSFFQINPEQTQKLYHKVMKMASFTGNEIIIDAYSGVGTIGMILSKNVKQVISVENNKQAVQNAIINAKINKMNNVHFICDDATKFIEELVRENQKIDAVIMDPPRSGSTELFLNSLLKLRPKKIIYVSCEAETQARDMKTLLKAYQIKESAIVDMFVGTYHVENIVLLSLK